MPIHFRCPHCNQLMGIARRKAGAIISCPTCTRQLIVPRPTKSRSGEKKAPDPDGLLERIDVDALLQPPTPGQAVASVGQESAASAAVAGKRPAKHAAERAKEGIPTGTSDGGSDPDSDLPSASVEAIGVGIFLSPGKATFLSVFVVLLLAVAFIAGLLLGRHVWPLEKKGGAGGSSAAALTARA